MRIDPSARRPVRRYMTLRFGGLMLVAALFLWAPVSVVAWGLESFLASAPRAGLALPVSLLMLPVLVWEGWRFVRDLGRPALVLSPEGLEIDRRTTAPIPWTEVTLVARPPSADRRVVTIDLRGGPATRAALAKAEARRLTDLPPGTPWRIDIDARFLRLTPAQVAAALSAYAAAHGPPRGRA